MQKKWNVLSQYDSSQDILTLVLANRGISTQAELDEFLNPKPVAAYLLEFSADFKKSVKVAKDLILQSIEQQEPILIFGDYDTDGVSATAILFHTLTKVLKYDKCTYFIPNRFDHGYGLSTHALEAATTELTNTFGPFSQALLITVDTGITAVDEVAFAKKLGYKVIITDHHQQPDPLPQADVLVWTDVIVGAGISWIVSKALGLPNLDLIDLVALATVTDLQELKGINRSIVKKGLEVLNTQPCVGIRKLLDAAGKTKEITAYDLGWVLGPRINALGRMDNASLGVELLTCEDTARAEDIAHTLGQTNVRRQDETEKMYELANIESGDDNLIFTANGEYHEGIIGLVASRLVQKHYKPAIVIAHDADSGLGKGSVRSVPGINIIDILRRFDSLFEKLGGHPMAAGFSIKSDNIEHLKTQLTAYMNSTFTADYFVPFLDIDVEIPLAVVSLDFYTQLSKLAPYGPANPEPVFCARGLKVADFSYVGRDSTHLSLKLTSQGSTFKAIYFNAPEIGATLAVSTSVAVAFSVSRNDFNGRITTDLILKDLVLE